MALTPRTAGCRRAWGLSWIARKEYLGPADRAIIVARRLLLQAVKTVEEGGDPPGADTSYYQARAVEQILPRGVAWRDALLPEMYPTVEPLAAAD